MRPLIHPWTVSPAEAGFETIHTMIRTATMMPMIFDNNGLASRSGSAAAVPGGRTRRGTTRLEADQSVTQPHDSRFGDGATSPFRPGCARKDDAASAAVLRPTMAGRVLGGVCRANAIG